MKYIALLFFSFWSTVSYAESINLLGTWEDTNPNNHWHMEVSFNRDLNQYEGRLFKQGAGSQSVGFTIGELVWTAIPITNTNQLDEQQKLRTGTNGVSIGVNWLPGTFSLDKSTDTHLLLLSLFLVEYETYGGFKNQLQQLMFSSDFSELYIMQELSVNLYR